MQVYTIAKACEIRYLGIKIQEIKHVYSIKLKQYHELQRYLQLINIGKKHCTKYKWGPREIFSTALEKFTETSTSLKGPVTIQELKQELNNNAQGFEHTKGGSRARRTEKGSQSLEIRKLLMVSSNAVERNKAFVLHFVFMLVRSCTCSPEWGKI